MTASELFSIPGFTDPFSSLSHLIGAGVCAVLAIPLVARGWGDRSATNEEPEAGRVVSLVIFAASAVLLLSMSGTFHLLQHEGNARAVLRRLDHAAIFVLIAGTFTPVHTIMFTGVLRWGMLAFVWMLAIAGVTLKSIYFTSTPETLGLALYLGMGWIGAISMIALAVRYGGRVMFPLFLGGVVYTVGAVIELVQPRPVITGVVRSHEIFHVAVLGGLACHWWFVWSIAGRGLPGGKVRSDVQVRANAPVSPAGVNPGVDS